MTYQEKLDSIVIVWRQCGGVSGSQGTLWGIPYAMRPDQSPGDLWKARERSREQARVMKPGCYGGSKVTNLDDWVYLGSPGWWETRDLEAKRLAKQWLAGLEIAGIELPRHSGEWVVLPK